MGLLPAIASTILYAIPAGPIGLVWSGHQTAWSPIFNQLNMSKGWLLVLGLIFVVGLAMVRSLVIEASIAPLLIQFLVQGPVRLRNAYCWRVVLVDVSFCLAGNPMTFVVPCRLQQYARPHQWLVWCELCIFSDATFNRQYSQ